MDDRLCEILGDIRERIVGLETQLDIMGDKNVKVIEAISDLNALIARVDKLDKIIFWAGTTIIGTVFGLVMVTLT